jgi:hypothetical protein
MGCINGVAGIKDSFRRCGSENLQRLATSVDDLSVASLQRDEKGLEIRNKNLFEFCHFVCARGTLRS